ncbi:MAG TPA: ABC transporter ATP-binding protein [Xanthobacteraceae bacterium]|nr:ABC transporter ATP-binding protein [Xanthobacteraceae bacterium]
MTLSGHRLTIGYPARTVGRDIDIAVSAGEVLALLGPNGGGKTTLLKTLLGLLPPLAGRITLDAAPLAKLGLAGRARRLAYVPQVHAPAFGFTVSSVVLMGRSAHGGLFSAPGAADRRSAATALERLRISHLADRPYTELSGGERQLVLLARALAQEPAFIILDEPTASLDFGNQSRVLQEMRRLAADGHGVIFTSHDPNHVLHAADRVAMLRDGGILRHGPMAEILNEAALTELYRSDVVEIADAQGRRAFTHPPAAPPQ